MASLQQLAMMAKHDSPDGYEDRIGLTDQRDTSIQLVLSIILGVSAFITFCFLRPKWPGLYAARKKQTGEASPLPDLPDSFFGWIPVVWKITEQQVLASAGLDAYVFLRFFKVAIKTLSVTLFFALVIIKPVHDAFPDNSDELRRNDTKHDNATYPVFRLAEDHWQSSGRSNGSRDGIYDHVNTDYLWMYLVFAYLFTVLAIYLLVTETQRIIAIRQEYLGSQATITDRTIRLSGIPKSLRSEDRIKDFIERLQIGKVQKITLCRNWQELDDKMTERSDLLRKVEEAWTVFLGRRRVERNMEALPIVQPSPPGPEIYQDEDEAGDSEHTLNGHAQIGAVPYARDRPTVTIGSGFFRRNGRKVDAIDYYEEKLKAIDEEIRGLREKDYEPTSLAFVTLDSVAACQMAAQAVLDPSPMHLIARQAPAPTDVIWSNTYLPRSNRMARAWLITAVITILTVFWSLVLVPLATALNLESIQRVWPELADAIDAHPIAKSLVQTQLPTLVSSLLFVAVPYLYDWLARLQGMESQADTDLSVISKNFFFLFFNYFIIFTVLGTFSNFYKFWEQFQDNLKDTTRIAYTLALSLQRFSSFYTNLIILQGIGLFPFRLLEIGSVILYPIYRIGCKTPRDYAELVQPPTFYYGFYLPQIILIFIICMVYSVLRESWKVLLSGLIYFVFGGFVYKYQLLYAMDHRQHSTGRAWMMICHRIVVGLVLFQLTTAGQLALKGGYKRAVLVVPLVAATVCFGWAYNRSYTPLMRFISLASIERHIPEETETEFLDPDGWGMEAAAHGRDVEAGNARINIGGENMVFVNPNLVSPLEKVWISDAGARKVGEPQSNGRYRDEEDDEED